MKITQRSDMLWLLMIILLGIVRSSHQTVYSCNSSASCGCSTNSATVSRIVGGENAAPATWGWAVSMYIGSGYLCGGSIISSSWIITAAHCVYGGYTASQITIYAGSTLRWTGTQNSTGANLFIHPSYNPSTYVNDIALLELTTPLTMSDPDVSTICLPTVNSSILAAGEWPPVGTSVVAVGWGRLTEGGSLPSTLQQVTVQTVDYQASTCTPTMADWHVQLCAGVPGGGKDTCQGDSGGPLMTFSTSQQWVLVGVTSSGIGCAEANYSGMYTRVAAFQDWISATTNGSSPELSSSIYSTESSSIETTASTTTAVIYLHANTVETSIFTILIFVSFNLFIAFLY